MDLREKTRVRRFRFPVGVGDASTEASAEAAPQYLLAAAPRSATVSARATAGLLKPSTGGQAGQQPIGELTPAGFTDV